MPGYRYESTTVVDAAPAVIAVHLASPEAWATWAPAVTVAVSTRRPRRIEGTARLPRSRRTATSVVELSTGANADMGTLVSWTLTGPRTAPGKLLGRLGANRLHLRDMASALERLRVLAER